jgi:hypothetical protein
MYIRRKVFSLAVDQETGEEKLFSTTDYQSQKEFSEKKAQKDKDTKAEKAAKATTIGGATVGLGAGAVSLGAEIGRKKVKKATNQLEMEKANILDKAKKATVGGKTIPTLTKNQEADLEIKKAAQKKLQKIDKVLEKVSKKGTKAGIAGVGASVAGAVAYKALKKKKEQKEFTSVRASKKMANRILKAADMLPANSKKELGKVVATANRKGLAKNSEKYIENKGFEKVAKSVAKKSEKLAGEKMSKAEKAKVIEDMKANAKETGKLRIERGNKAFKL